MDSDIIDLGDPNERKVMRIILTGLFIIGFVVGFVVGAMF
jgi:hypothetical protein